jgi:hypothetical protein
VVDGRAHDLLGRGVGEGADEVALLGDPLQRVREVRRAEVDDLHAPVRQHLDVGALEVAVDQPAVVDVLKGVRR